MNEAAAARWERERRWLGYAGLVPFLACLAVVVAAGPRSWVEPAGEAMRHYAAVIASFLGAVHWGTAAAADDGRQRAHLRWGVTPALLAWVLLALPVRYALAGFAALLVLAAMVDRYLLPLLDEDYRRLRLRLTLVAVAALGAAALALPP